MKEGNKDRTTMNLPFEGNEEPLKPGEKGYLPPGWRWDEKEDLLDEEGNIRDSETGNILAEKPSPGLKKARELYPNAGREEIAFWARRFNNQFEAKDNKRHTKDKKN